MSSRSIRNSGYPLGSIEDLIANLGSSHAFHLLAMKGGQYIYSPVMAASDHPYRTVLGDACFEALVAAYPGISFDLPKYDAIIRAQRHRMVMELVDRGLKHSDIARETNYTRRHVLNIIGHLSTPLPQMDLFADMEPAELDAERMPTAHNPFGLRGMQSGE